MGVKFSGLSQEAADFLFSRSGKCQVGQKPLAETHGETRTDRRPLPEGREKGRGRGREQLVFSVNMLYIKLCHPSFPQIN